MSLRNRIKHLLWTSRRERAYQELSDELENHLQLSIEEKIAEGCSSEEAGGQPASNLEAAIGGWKSAVIAGAGTANGCFKICGRAGYAPAGACGLPC